MLPKINIYSSDFVAEEGLSTASFTLVRTGDLQNELSCAVAFAGTAVSGVDFELLSETVNFAVGQDTVTLLINPKSDSTLEGAELVTCTIQDNAAYLIENASATISISDKGYVDDGFVAKLEDTFLLHSKPDAKHTIYLDFFGGDYYTYNTILPYNSDGDASNLSDAEKLEIQKIWVGIAEDFAPFNIDVTTETPADGALVNTGGDDDAWGVSLLIGEETTGYGFAWSGSEFPLDYEAPGYVSINSPYKDGIYPLDLIAAGGSHEIAHTMGLIHDGPGPGGYYSGHDTAVGHWNPIMGQSNSGLTQFSKGDYENADNTEDDLSIIASDLNGISYIIDEHADERSFATKLANLDDDYGSLFAQGIISTSADVDWFYFDHSGGSIVLNVDVAEFSPNLHAGAWLYDSNGVELIASTNESSLSAAIISSNLSAGRYYLKIDGIGNDSGGGYTDYGSLGHYSVSTGAAVIADFTPNGEYANSSVAGTSAIEEISLSDLSGNGFSNVYWSDSWALYWAGNDTLDLNQYIGFSVSYDNSEKVIRAEKLETSFYSLVSGTTTFVLRSSQDNFVSDIDTQSIAGYQNAELLSFDLSALSDLDPQTEFRIYVVGGGEGYRYLTGDTWSFDKPGAGLELSARVIDIDTTNPNNTSPNGDVLIIGDPTQNQTLSADVSGIADVDGLGVFSYQWNADGKAIFGETDETLKLNQEHVGRQISLTLSYKDGLNTRENVTSASTAKVTNVNDNPSGSLAVIGQAYVGTALTADTSGLIDADGIVTSTFSYQWLRDGVDIPLANQRSYTLVNTDLGAEISVKVSFDDQFSKNELVISNATSKVQEALPEPVILINYNPDFEEPDQSVFINYSAQNLVASDLSSENHFGWGIDNVWALYWNGLNFDPTEFISFKIAPTANSKILPETLSALIYSEAYGQTSFSVRSNLDNFAADLDTAQIPGNSSSSLVEFDLADLPIITDEIEFRIYASEGGEGYRKLVGVDFSNTDSNEGLTLLGRVITENASDSSSNTITDTSGSDLLVGTAQADNISAGEGADLVQAGAGNDTITLQSSDTWSSFYRAWNVETNDRQALDGKTKYSTVIDAGDDADTLILSDSSAGDAFFLHDSYSGLHNSLTAIDDGFGRTTVARALNLETIKAGDGNDIIDLTSPTFDMGGIALTLEGEAGDDILWAAEGDDTLNGGAGNDVLFGGEGNDTLIGGTDADVFEFVSSTNAQTDTISDYSSDDKLKFYLASGQSELDQSNISNGDLVWNNLTIDLVGTDVTSLDQLNIVYDYI